jgi:hypothetical protein
MQRPATASRTRLNVAMIRLRMDENFDQRILRGLQLRLPSLDAVSVQDTAGCPQFSSCIPAVR